ncbi:unnamed protein product [Caenorhabditis bovis]|uniref:Uncharacterized protein n=1 Tax=Caenorhabditis bovis TaxID=2654633 RepID=A0A8S1F7S9_9PELO|nr:unnamed protein product [Caenorhabditis bovis]
MRLHLIFIFILIIVCSNAQNDDVNPEDVDDVKPPVEVDSVGQDADVHDPTTKEKDEKENQEPQNDKENAAPEFDVKPDVEGGKGEEDPDANVDKPVQVDPPKDEADGAAKEDRETAAIGSEGLHEAVEEARGNPGAVAEVKKPITDEEQTLETAPIIRPHRIDSMNRQLEQIVRSDESTGFMSFFFVATFLIVCIYLLQHNKKKILGLMFEGRRSGGRRGGNVKYRRLSQSDQD